MGTEMKLIKYILPILLFLAATGYISSNRNPNKKLSVFEEFSIRHEILFIFIVVILGVAMLRILIFFVKEANSIRKRAQKEVGNRFDA